MKKIIITLGIVLTLSITGILYAIHEHTDEGNAVTLAQAYESQYPVEMPQVTLHNVTPF